MRSTAWRRPSNQPAVRLLGRLRRLGRYWLNKSDFENVTVFRVYCRAFRYHPFFDFPISQFWRLALYQRVSGRDSLSQRRTLRELQSSPRLVTQNVRQFAYTTGLFNLDSSLEIRCFSRKWFLLKIYHRFYRTHSRSPLGPTHWSSTWPRDWQLNDAHIPLERCPIKCTHTHRVLPTNLFFF